MFRLLKQSKTALEKTAPTIKPSNIAAPSEGLIPASAFVGIGHGVRVKGRLSFFGFSWILGSFSGQLFSTGELTIAPGAAVSGKITAQRLVVHGEIDAEVLADVVEVHEGAIVRGAIAAKQCVFKSRALLQASLKIAA